MVDFVPLGSLIAPARSERAGRDEYPVLSITRDDGLVFQSSRFKKRIAGADLSNYKVITKGQLVVGFPIDEAVIDFQTICEAGIVSPAYGVWELFDEQRVDMEYLRKYLRSDSAVAQYKLRLRGTTARRRSLTKEAFQSIQIPLPPLSEQRRIAAILDEANGLINKLKKQLGLLERQDVNVVEKFLASTNYSFKALSEVCEVNPITRFPTGISEKIPFIPMGAVSESGVLTFTEWRRMDEVRSGYTRFRKNDVLVAKITPCYENGKSAIATIDEDLAAGSTEFHVFRCGANLDPRFLHAVLNSTVVRTTGIANMRGSSGHRRVPAWVFANLKIPVPPIEIQKELMDSIDEGIERKRRSVQKQLRSSIELFQSLSTRAFQGEL
ncbi:restriction endonuclease subunit S [Corynebacterium aurimucosum]